MNIITVFFSAIIVLAVLIFRFKDTLKEITIPFSSRPNQRKTLLGLLGLLSFIGIGYCISIWLSMDEIFQKPFVVYNDSREIVWGKVKEIKEIPVFDVQLTNGEIQEIGKRYQNNLFFDQNGLLTKRESSYYFEIGETPLNESSDIFRYNKKSELLEIIEKSGNNEVITKFKQNEDGYNIGANIFDGVTGELTRREVYHLDSKGRKVEIHYLDNVGRLYQKDSITYHLNGTIKDQTSFVPNPEVLNHWLAYQIFYFDKRGLEIKFEENFNNKDIVFKRTLFHRDQNGNQIRNEYTHNNDELADRSYSIQDYVWTTEHFNYDEMGNWTKRIWYKDGFPKQVIHREIQYYL